jgi:hypothetical protein
VAKGEAMSDHTSTTVKQILCVILIIVLLIIGLS